jgi:hypothetical protein
MRGTASKHGPAAGHAVHHTLCCVGAQQLQLLCGIAGSQSALISPKTRETPPNLSNRPLQGLTSVVNKPPSSTLHAPSHTLGPTPLSTPGDPRKQRTHLCQAVCVTRHLAGSHHPELHTPRHPLGLPSSSSSRQQQLLQWPREGRVGLARLLLPHTCDVCLLVLRVFCR